MIFILIFLVLNNVILILIIVREESAEIVWHSLAVEVLRLLLEFPQSEFVLLLIIFSKLVIDLAVAHVHALLLQHHILAICRVMVEFKAYYALRVQEHTVLNLRVS